MTAHPATPSTASGVPSSTFKPRLLYRGPLRLADATLLPGVAFVSTVSPFESSSPSSKTEEDNYDADICLALEMVRGHRMVGIELLDEDDIAEVQPKSLGGLGTHKVHRKEVDVTLEATGRVKMYLDPREQATVSFFQRHFCWRDDWSKPGRLQSRMAFALSTATTSQDFLPCSQSQSQDPFVNSYSQCFGPPSSLDRKTTQLVLFARLSGDAQELDDGVRSLDILVGRRVVKRRKGRQALEKVPRPDDPLPRAAALADLIFSQRIAPPLRSTSPADPPLIDRSKATKEGRTSTAVSVPSAPPSEDVSGDGANGTATASVSRPPGILPRSRVQSGGNHTPGRRGEKRHKTTAFTEELTQGRIGSPRSQVSQMSPSKRRRADEIDLTTSRRKSERGSSSTASGDHPPQPSRNATLRPPPLSIVTHKSNKVTPTSSAAVSPEPPDSAICSSLDDVDDSISISKVKEPSNATTKGSRDPKKNASATAAAASASAAYSSLESRNRATIKKLVQHQLLGRGLERGDEDFERCFPTAYHGTVLALRQSIGGQLVDRQRAAQLVACHLAMYLPPQPELGALPPPLPTPTPAPALLAAATPSLSPMHEYRHQTKVTPIVKLEKQDGDETLNYQEAEEAEEGEGKEEEEEEESM